MGIFGDIFSVYTYGMGNLSNAKKTAKEAEQTALYTQRLLTSSQNQETRARATFSANTSNRYGASFLDALQSGKSTSELIASISSETALGKTLQNYEDQAKLAVSNAQRNITQTGLQASRQGQANLLSSQELERQAAQASGQASAAQAVSGIKAGAGTGSNTAEMQKQVNDAARAGLELQIKNSNRNTITGMNETAITAGQQAEQLRTQMGIASQSALEDALADYGNFSDTMAQMDEDQANMQLDINYWEKEQTEAEESTQGWNGVATFFGF